MPKIEVVLPEMGEGVVDATVIAWLKNIGDTVTVDEAVVEVATDKVDSEVVSEVSGTIVELCAKADDVVKVGQPLFIVATEGSEGAVEPEQDIQELTKKYATPIADKQQEEKSVDHESVAHIERFTQVVSEPPYRTATAAGHTKGFLSPLVRSIAEQEGLTASELDQIEGTGLDHRITKDDILLYISKRNVILSASIEVSPSINSNSFSEEKPQETPVASKVSVQLEKAYGDEIIALNRMAKLTAKNMMQSVLTSAHVQSFIEVDVTNVVEWRASVKQEFERIEGEKLTFTPIFMEAVSRALKAYPKMNIQFDGETVIQKKAINIGMAAALEDGNLIVPVINEADTLNLSGLARKVNDLADRARTNALKPAEVMNATYTVTNIGSFGSVFGTPIIPQPQVGILAIGAIRKIPSVVETEQGEFLGIRHKMYLSHSYDHRVVNGALGGLFIKYIADYLENWDPKRAV
jgi:2-oxoglutarate dehydrogenase E2 component (dihydrolipoamide succinyltransferase)